MLTVGRWKAQRHELRRACGLTLCILQGFNGPPSYLKRPNGGAEGSSHQSGGWEGHPGAPLVSRKCSCWREKCFLIHHSAPPPSPSLSAPDTWSKELHGTICTFSTILAEEQRLKTSGQKKCCTKYNISHKYRCNKIQQQKSIKNTCLQARSFLNWRVAV